MSKIKPNIVRGGTAIDLGNNLYLMRGRKHSSGGIDIGRNPRTGLEVEGDEVIQTSPSGLRVFSAQPILNGISPAQYILGGANPNDVFNAQEFWKKANRVTDDGKRYRTGGKVDEKTFTTKLTKKQEDKFQNWYKNVSYELGLDSNPDNPLHAYDYRGFWLENRNKDIDYTQPDFHFTDTYKKPDHPTFSVESKYADKKYGIDPKTVGHWDGENFISGSFNDLIAARTDKPTKQLEYSKQPYEPSKEIIDYIKSTEGFRDKWYQDGKGIWTVGYGFTGSKVRKMFPNGMTREQADKYLTDSLNVRKQILQKDTPNWDSLNQNQRDALLSYHYNIGEGNYRNSPKMQKGLEEKDWDTVSKNIDAGYNDKKNPGLRKRRDYERNLFNTPVEYKYGGRVKKPVGGEKERKVIGYGNNFDSRLRYLDLDQKLVAYINKIAKDYNISPALLTNRLFHEGAIDNAIKNYDYSVKKGVKTNSLLDSDYIDNDSYNLYGLDDSYTLLKNGKLKLNRNIPVKNKFSKNEKGRIVNYAGASDPYDAIELMASNISYIKNEMQNKFPNIKDKDLDTITNKAFNMGLYGAIDDVKNNGVGSKYIIDDRLYNYNYNNDFYLKNNNRNDIINTFTVESQNNLFNDYKDVYKNNFIEKHGEEFNNPTNSPNFLKNKITKQGDSAEEYSDYKADKTFKDTYFYPLGTDYSYNNPFFKIKTEFKYGGIHIKPSKRGTFTAAAKKHGMGVQAFASKVLANKDNYSSAMVKKANFARNASKWNHKEFGGDMTYSYILGKNNIYRLGGSKKRAPYGDEIIWRPTSQDLHRPRITRDDIDYGYINGNLYDRFGNPRFDTDIEPAVAVAERPSLGLNIGIDDKRFSPYTSEELDAMRKSIVDKYQNEPIGNSLEVANPITSNNTIPNPGNGFMKSNNTTKENKVKGNGVNSDLIGAGINLVGNLGSFLINNVALNKMKYYNMLPLRANKLKTNFNINPQLDNIRENVADFEEDTRNNTASSKVALSRRQRMRARGAQAVNQLYGQKENIETQLINRDRLNQQQVANQNVSMRNQWRAGLSEFRNKKLEAKAENAVSAINNAADAIAGPSGYLARRERRLENDRLLARDLLSLELLSATNPNAGPIVDDIIKNGIDSRYYKLLKKQRSV